MKWDGGSFTLNPGDSCLVPAALQGVTISGRTAVMCATVPDRPALREALGYRAELVAGLTGEI